MKKIFIILACLIFVPSISLARTPSQINDWYIKDFHSNIKVQQDSSLLITEMITADCGNLSGKHGIFRTLPYEIKTDSGEVIKNYINLVSITDFYDKKISHTESKDYTDKTVTWKIGDPNKTVTGENYYKITYRVKNAIRFQDNFDEFYWNLSGNFWQLEIDNFEANIILPEKFNKDNVEVAYYTGQVGGKEKNGAQLNWKENTLEFKSLKTFYPGQGITVSISFPQGFFIPYQPPLWIKYLAILNIIFPLVTFFICFSAWKKHGKDPKLNKTIIPEFEIPDNLNPLEMGTLLNKGRVKNEFLSAGLVNLAVKGKIKFSEEKTGTIFKTKDIKMIKNPGAQLDSKNLEEKLAESILSGKNEVLFSSLKKKRNFGLVISGIKKEIKGAIFEKELMNKTGASLKTLFLVLAIVVFFLTFTFFALFGLGLLFSSLIMFIFSFLMPKVTPKGAELIWKIKGFKLYMETAEKYRQQFNEKENIFEKFLPYAIMFGITKLWAKKMEALYGKDYFKNYHPIWYTGLLANNFDIDSLTTSLEGVSSSIASNISSSSGAGGGGFSGGGGGGGGGGGW